ncbi:MAG TPA: hydroxymethylpyrimidine/phosphomethylpyrimidine kinase [Flavobacteriales bacterium]|nr:hydroxymethylpyrimidine/phosphomethylpyrimidine kinase [Flavobacteriales bacterium]
MRKRPYILTIAGFDPTGGAGILADCKTFEKHKCLGMAIITANTIQTEDEFRALNPVENNLVLAQLEALLKKYYFNYVKIGLIPNLELLRLCIELLKKYLPDIKIIWDPVLSASAGKEFNINLNDFDNLLNDIFLLTPNFNEVKILGQEDDAFLAAEKLAQKTNVYLKGGHNPENPAKDYLYFNQKCYPLNPKPKQKIYPKHGSGCILASAITANLAKGYPMIKACLRAKRYIEKVMSSNPSLLCFHYE